MDFTVRLTRKNIPDDELLDDLKRIANESGEGTVSYDIYDQVGMFRARTIERRFGGWNEALLKAGIDPSYTLATDQELFENIVAVWTTLGRQPTRTDMRKPLSKRGGTTYENRFGTWNSALLAFSDWVSSDVNPVEQSPVPDKKKRRTGRTVDYRLRFRVMQRDNFTCKCGRSPAKDPEVILHIDHIHPWAQGGETEFDNLQTLCSKCNLGKSDLVL